MDKTIIRVDGWYEDLITELNAKLMFDGITDENMGGSFFLMGSRICVSMDMNIETEDDFVDIKIICRSEEWDVLLKYQKVVSIVKELQLQHIKI